MPDVKPGESQDAYMARCVPIVIGEGKSPAEAQAICRAKYKAEHGGGQGNPNAPHGGSGVGPGAASG